MSENNGNFEQSNEETNHYTTNRNSEVFESAGNIEDLDLDDVSDYVRYLLRHHLDERLHEASSATLSPEETIKSESFEGVIGETDRDFSSVELTRSESSPAESSKSEEVESGTTDEDVVLEYVEELTSRVVKEAIRQAEIREYANHPLARLPDDNVIEVVEKLEADIKHYQLENQVFLNVLQQEPELIKDMDTLIRNKTILSKFRRSVQRSQNIDDSQTTRVTYAQKIDLVLHEIEEVESKLSGFEKRSNQLRYHLKAAIQEIDLRQVELDEIVKSFENTFDLSDNQAIQKIPVEKFVHFIKDTIRRTIIKTDKIRLQFGPLQKQYRKICMLCKQKQQLGEDIKTVDFEQLQIKNKRLRQEIELKSNLLKSLRHINGAAHLSLINQKKSLLKNEKDLKTVQNNITVREKKIVQLEKECEKAAEDLERIKYRHEKIKEQAEKYKLPDINEYIKMKAAMSRSQSRTTKK